MSRKQRENEQNKTGVPVTPLPSPRSKGGRDEMSKANALRSLGEQVWGHPSPLSLCPTKKKKKKGRGPRESPNNFYFLGGRSNSIGALGIFASLASVKGELVPPTREQDRETGLPLRHPITQSSMFCCAAPSCRRIGHKSLPVTDPKFARNQGARSRSNDYGRNGGTTLRKL